MESCEVVMGPVPVIDITHAKGPTSVEVGPLACPDHMERFKASTPIIPYMYTSQ